jgi:hypothetical protein
MSGMMGMNTGNPQMGSAMEEFRKNAETVKGMPLLQTVSMGLAGSGLDAQSGESTQGNRQAQAPPPQETQTQDTSVPTSKSGAISQGLGGVFGGLRKKKQQQQQQQQQQEAQNSSAAGTEPASTSNSLMDMTVEVTSVSTASLENDLFEVPAGYTQVQKSADDIVGGKRP